MNAEDASLVYDDLRNVWTTSGRPSEAGQQFELATDQRDLELPGPIDPAAVYDFSIVDSAVPAR